MRGWVMCREAQTTEWPGIKQMKGVVGHLENVVLCVLNLRCLVPEGASWGYSVDLILMLSCRILGSWGLLTRLCL